MSLSSIDLCASALIKIGANGISSFDDGTTEAHVAASLYPVVRDGLLSCHPWTFATTQAQLARLSISPVADFENAYALPSTCLRVLSAGSDGSGDGIVYSIRGRQLHTDATEVTITYVSLPSEAQFPAYFNLALIARLAAEFCIPLTDSTTRWKGLNDYAEAELRRAKLSDSLEDTPPALQDFSLVEDRT